MPPPAQKIVPVILSGGSGTRLWPLSRDARPKQFIGIVDAQVPIIEDTIRRVAEPPTSGPEASRSIGKTWLERSMFFATQTRDAVMDAWTKLIQSRQPGRHDIPPKDRGPEMSR